VVSVLPSPHGVGFHLMIQMILLVEPAALLRSSRLPRSSVLYIYGPCIVLTSSNRRHNSAMAHNTAKLGGSASDVVVAKVGVSCTILSNAIFNIYSHVLLIHSMGL
jgi:hypothetical protein